uniref:Uncharacterized protein n=1 Tax=viral metagenome TaxID=1070528 RepID=A0A6H2A6K4_9ZZZZ
MKSFYRKRAILLSEAYAKGMYKDFTEHCEYRGENFSWEKFPDMVANLAKVGLFTCFSDKEWYYLDQDQREELEKYCHNATVRRVKKLIELGGLNGN